MRQLFKNKHILAIFTQGIGAVLGFSSFLLLVRVLDKDGFGTWVLYITAATFLDMLRTGLVRPALIRFLADPEGQDNQEIIGAGWVLSGGITAALALIVMLTGMIFDLLAFAADLSLFFVWWPLLAVSCLPLQFAIWNQQAEQRFDRILALRVVVNGTFALALLLAFLEVISLGLVEIVQVHIASNVLASLLALVTSWAPLRAIRQATRKACRTLFEFGRYSVGTLLGATLLRSSDTFILGAVLGPAAVALYSVPQKLMEALEIPLRGLAATAYPTMSRHCLRGDLPAMQRFLTRSSGALTIAFAPVVIAGCIWAEELVILLGGEEYAGAATMLRIFLLYSMLLPLDRYLGLALDSLNKPQRNTVKVIVMVCVNVIGDFAALYFFGTPESVAVVTIITTLWGIGLGRRQLREDAELNFQDLARDGWQQLMASSGYLFNMIYTRGGASRTDIA